MNNIKYSRTLSSYKLEFLNGTIEVPDHKGVYCIASGCGSGKTTIIKQMMEKEFDNGIIVFCKTIRECNELYDHIAEFAYNSGLLKLNEIINLCSEPRFEKVGRKTVCTNGVDLSWKNNLSMLEKKKVVIATHSVLVNTPINALMKVDIVKGMNHISKPNIIQEGLLGIASVVTIRQFMIIDELPLDRPLQKTYGMAEMLPYTNLVEILTPDLSAPGKLNRSHRFDTKYLNYEHFDCLYEIVSKVNPKFRFLGGDTELADARKDMILSIMLSGNVLGEKVTEACRNNSNSVTFKYNLPNMLYAAQSGYGGIGTNVWIFEGTGDITLSKSPLNSIHPLYRMMSFPKKYEGEKVNIFKVTNYLSSRTVKVDSKFSKKDKVLEALDKNVRMLSKIVESNKETLIIVWKDLRMKLTKDEVLPDALTSTVLNDDFDLVEYYTKRIEGILGLGHKFHVIHYGSGLDLSTNQFRDCDAIVRLGLYQIPNDALNEINDDLKTGMNMHDLILYQNVQALSRTKIRLHKGDKVRFYISEDYGTYIDDLANYLKNEGVEVNEYDSTGLDYMHKKLVDNILKLGTYDSSILRARFTESKYSKVMTLDEIYDILKDDISTKETRKFSSTIASLATINVDLTIE